MRGGQVQGGGRKGRPDLDPKNGDQKNWEKFGLELERWATKAYVSSKTQARHRQIPDNQSSVQGWSV